MSSLQSIAGCVKINSLHSVHYTLQDTGKILVTVNRGRLVGIFNNIRDAQEVVRAITIRFGASTRYKDIASGKYVTASSSGIGYGMNGVTEGTFTHSIGIWTPTGTAESSGGVQTVNTGTITHTNSGASLKTYPLKFLSRCEIRDSKPNQTPASPTIQVTALGSQVFTARAKVVTLGSKVSHILGFYRSHSQASTPLDANSRAIEACVCFIADEATTNNWVVYVNRRNFSFPPDPFDPDTYDYLNVANVNTGISCLVDHDFCIEINAAGTSALFYIDGVLVHTQVGNLPLHVLATSPHPGLFVGAAIRDNLITVGSAVAGELLVKNMVYAGVDNPYYGSNSFVPFSAANIVATPQTPLYSVTGVTGDQFLFGYDMPISFKVNLNNSNVKLWYKTNYTSMAGNTTTHPSNDGYTQITSDSQLVFQPPQTYLVFKCSGEGYTTSPLVTTATLHNVQLGAVANTFTMTYTNPAPP
jgi:hypothetical protein